MAQARNVGENIVALSYNPMLLWGSTLEELERKVQHPYLTEYALAVMEGMGLATHTDSDNLYWDKFERKSDDDGPVFRFRRRIDFRPDSIASDSRRTVGRSP